ncbi:MAG: pirin family protein [Lewinellaceae bacterium]|nr:pirin family protein [Lewinellaceae bacterium]
MINRSVAHISPATALQMGKTTVKQPLPTQRVEQISPFLLLHHFGPTLVAPGEDPLDVGPHPHRGFEPVTFLFQGGIRHKDSQGNEGILQGGDVQWMTAGRGIIHSERASREFLETGGTMEGIQLWVNLPKAHKRAPARYQDIKAGQIPQLTLDEGRVSVAVVAGSFGEVKGPAQTYTPVTALTITLQAGGEVAIPLPEDHNALLYIVKGNVIVNGNFDYTAEQMLQFRNDGEGITLKAVDNSLVLVLAGEPIDEPLAQWGPYVMNTQTEIMEAMRDYQMGKMGFYID